MFSCKSKGDILGPVNQNSGQFTAYVWKLGVNVSSCSVVALQCILCDNRPGSKQGKEGRVLHDGRKATKGQHVCVAYI